LKNKALFLSIMQSIPTFFCFFGGTTDAHLTLHSFFPPSSREPKKDMICLSILVATVDGIGNKERLFIIELIKQ
jgi:hypothetical protein